MIPGKAVRRSGEGRTDLAPASSILGLLSRLIKIVGLSLLCTIVHAQTVGEKHSPGSVSTWGSQRAAEDQEPTSLLQSARLMASQQKWRGAENALHRYLDHQPESFEGHALLGLVLHNEGRAKESMLEYIEAAKLGDLSSSDLTMYALDCASLHDFEDADKWLTRALQMNPADWQGWNAAGHFKFELQHYDDAIKAFQECLRLKPKMIAAQSGIGLAYEASGRPDDAAAAYWLAIQWQQAPSRRDYVPFLGLGRTLLNQGKPAEALPLLREAVRLSPKDVSSRQMLGKAYSSLNAFGPARAELETAVRLDPQDADAHFMLAQVYRNLGLKERAEAELALYSSLKNKK